MTLMQKLDNLIAEVAEAEGTTLQSALRDVLTDLRHIAAARNLDFDFAAAGAVRGFEEEQEQAEANEE